MTESMRQASNRGNEMDIKPLHTEADYDSALDAVSELLDANPDRDTPDGDRLEILLALVSVYEDEHYPVPPPDPIEAIKFRMEQQGLTAADLIPYIGARNRVHEVLNGTRQLTLPMIRRLHEGLGIPAESLIGREEREAEHA
jgi:HTH-type transcriptional regulator / antitoxin HigA